MTRQEFPAKVKDQAFARSKGLCEKRGCGLPLQVGKFTYDHILPDALGGKPVLANCQVICRACDKIKTGEQDIPRIRKADRQSR
jgi:5-methylcytosine-specific restriction protein A